MEGLVDILKDKPTSVKCAVGEVKLVDCMPRLVPIDRTCEVAVVRSARVSYGLGLKDKISDDNLIRFLYRNQHTSPFESIEFQFYIKCPKYVATQLLRHRTGSFNEFSQRYAEVPQEEGFFKPSSIVNGIRGQDKINKQSSITIDNENVNELVKQTELHCEKTFDLYGQLLKLGMSRETARFCLPMSVFTTLYFKMNLNNLLKFLRLRMDLSAQWETRQIANGIYQLIKPLVPIVMECFDDYTLETITLSKKEIESIKNKTSFKGSKTEEQELNEKLRKLGWK